MKNEMLPKYTVGFIFNKDISRVLLIHKQKPEWQRGKVNGVGGKLETGETPVDCMRRETEEETTLEIAEQSWIQIGHMEQSAGDVAIFAAVYEGDEESATRGDHEEVEWFPISALPQNVIGNLPWLIPLCINRLRTGEPRDVRAMYP